MEEYVLQYIKSGMIIGLGSGTTMNRIIKKLAIYQQNGLQIVGVPTSIKTEKLSNELGIPLLPLSEVTHIDIAIDGANEIDHRFNAIKGGGGSLVREKIIGYFANELILIADRKKQVQQLGNLSVPVEVVPFGWEIIVNHYIKKLGGHATLRLKDNSPFISDNGNYILDCKFNKITDPTKLHENIKQIVGVVETGLFTKNISKIIFYDNNNIEELNKV